jgi:hypothetical protein
MGKLNNSGACDIVDGYEAGTCRQHGFLRIWWSPMWVKCGGSARVRANRKNVGKFFHVERAKGHRKASEEAFSIFSFLFVYPQQCVAVCFIQTLRQAFQNIPDIRWKTAAQPIDLANSPLKPTARERISIDCGAKTIGKKAHMPFAPSDNVSMISCDSSSFHPFVFEFERTVDLMYLTTSFCCPTSS